MTVTIDIPYSLEERLRVEAQRQGLPVDEFARNLIETHLRSCGSKSEAVVALQSWIDDADGVEADSNTAEIMRALDDDRMSNRKLYPDELKGITW